MDLYITDDPVYSYWENVSCVWANIDFIKWFYFFPPLTTAVFLNELYEPVSLLPVISHSALWSTLRSGVIASVMHCLLHLIWMFHHIYPLFYKRLTDGRGWFTVHLLTDARHKKSSLQLMIHTDPVFLICLQYVSERWLVSGAVMKRKLFHCLILFVVPADKFFIWNLQESIKIKYIKKLLYPQLLANIPLYLSAMAQKRFLKQVMGNKAKQKLLSLC